MGIGSNKDKKGVGKMKVMVFLAEGFEEVEALTVVDYLRRMDIEVDMVSISEDEKVEGAHGIEVIGNKLINDVNLNEYDGVVMPGGLPGAANLAENDQVIDIVRDFHKEEKLIAAICAGPVVLQKAGIIDGKDFTCFPGFEGNISDGNYVEKNTVRDGNIITGKGPALAINFALEIVDYLLGEEKKEDLKKDILSV